VRGTKTLAREAAVSPILTQVAVESVGQKLPIRQTYFVYPREPLLHPLDTRPSTRKPPRTTAMEEGKEQSKSAQKKAEKQAKMAAAKAEKAAKQATLPVVGGKKAEDLIGITVSKADNFSQWYQEVVVKAEMIEYYTEISGFFVMRPATMYIWNTIRKWFQERIETLGVEECNFPMFLSQKSLEKEKDHIDGFAPELAWVTKA